jgi:dynactin 1
MPHLSDARSAKSSFQLTTVLTFVKQIATSTVAKDLKPGGNAWEAVGTSISQLLEQGSKLLPSAMEPENVLKSL